MAVATIPRPRDAQALQTLLDSPELAELIADLEEARWTGRPATRSGPWSACACALGLVE